MNRVTFHRVGDEVAVSFRYDAALVEVARALPRRRFDPDTKAWLVPLHACRDAVRAFEATPCIVHVEPEVEALLLAPAIPEPPAPRVWIARDGEDYALRFAFDPRVVRAVKSIPGRRFDPDRKLWLVPIEDPADTLRAVLRQLRFAECEVDLEDALRRYLAP